MRMSLLPAPALVANSPVVVALVAAVTVLAVVGIWLMAVYNGLVTRRVRVQNAFAQIDVQLRRRHDLVPNLVAAVKGYMQHERATLEAVTSARAAAMTAQARVGAAPGRPSPRTPRRPFPFPSPRGARAASAARSGRPRPSPRPRPRASRRRRPASRARAPPCP